MSWQAQLRGDSLSWLLETSAPEIRYLVLRDLLDCPDADVGLRAARAQAHQTGPIAHILDQMNEEGYWVEPGSGYLPKYRSTVWSVILLAQLGASINEDQRIAKACAYILDHALAPGGQFTASGAPSGTADCLQGNLAWALLEMGCQDPRLEKAFDWMARSVTGEGLAPSNDRKATDRYYAGKCGPDFACGSNNRLPCAWGAVKVMLAFGKWPEDRQTLEIKKAIARGISFLLSGNAAMADYPTGYSDKPSQNWWKFGFPVFYVTDLLQVTEALVSVGCGEDPRLSGVLSLIREKQDEDGRWLLEYDYAGKTWVEFGAKKQPNKWVTLRALRVLKATGTA